LTNIRTYFFPFPLSLARDDGALLLSPCPLFAPDALRRFDAGSVDADCGTNAQDTMHYDIAPCFPCCIM
jgi:hypothetical protein